MRIFDFYDENAAPLKFPQVILYVIHQILQIRDIKYARRAAALRALIKAYYALNSVFPANYLRGFFMLA